jgi:hypothetical protein
MNNLHKVYIWPDGTFCTKGQLEEYLTFMSDDYVTRETCVCERCGWMITPSYDEPFADCDCGTQEWYF